jgi:hypothetical protein
MTVTQRDRSAEVRNARRLVQAAGLLFYIAALQALLTAGVGVDVYLSGGAAQDLALPATSALLAVSYTVVGYFLRRYWVWARNFAVAFAFAFAAVSIFAFPVGTVLGGLVVLCIDRANRAGVFPVRRPAPAPAPRVAVEEAPVLRFEPELAAERAG